MAAPEWTHYHEKKRKSVTRLKDRESFIFNFHNNDVIVNPSYLLSVRAS